MAHTARHYKCFYGEVEENVEAIVDQLSPTHKDFVPDESSVFRVLATFSEDKDSEALILLCETVYAVGLRAFYEPDIAIAKIMEVPKKLGWMGTNRQFPTADNTTTRSSSAQKSAAGRLGAPLAAKGKRDSNVQALLENNCEVRKASLDAWTVFD